MKNYLFKINENLYNYEKLINYKNSKNYPNHLLKFYTTNSIVESLYSKFNFYLSKIIINNKDFINSKQLFGK